MGSCTSCCMAETVKLDEHTVILAGMLGQGGYSYVYEARDVKTGQRYALKLMRCTEEVVERGKRELELLKNCAHNQNVVSLVDSTIREAPGAPGTFEVYFLFPLYKRGHLRGIVEDMAKAGLYWTEKEVLTIFLGICRGLLALHSLEPPIAHRDLKCMNILLSDRNEPLLMDFGSADVARRTIRTRQEALQVEDDAEKCSSVLFRPPEFFDTPINFQIDERTDIWSLGCTLYELAFGLSPFEKEYTHHGASIKLCALNGKLNFPSDSRYSEEFHELIRWMMHINLNSRPFLDEIIDRVSHMVK